MKNNSYWSKWVALHKVQQGLLLHGLGQWQGLGQGFGQGLGQWLCFGKG